MEKLDLKQQKSILNIIENKGNNNEYLNDLWSKYQNELKKKQKYLDNSIEIFPDPQFVCKGILFDKETNKSCKVFINVCSHNKIDDPEIMKQNKTNNDGIRFPICCGPQIIIDNDNNISSFDVVFNPNVCKNAMNNIQFRDTICQIAAQNISHKLKNKEIRGPFKYPRSIYKGINDNKKPYPQRIKKKNAPMIQENDEKMEAVVGNKTNAVKSVKTIIKNNIKKIKIIYKNEFDDMLFDDLIEMKLYLKNIMNDELINIKAIHFEINLPDKCEFQKLSLNMNQHCIELKYEINNCVLFDIKWKDYNADIPQCIDEESIKAACKKKKCLMKICVSFV